MTLAETVVKRSPRGSSVSTIVRESLIIVVVSLTISLALKTFVVQLFVIPSGSMEPTLHVGDRVVVSRLTPALEGIHRGDVIVFRDPGGWLPPPAPPAGGVAGAARQLLTFVGALPRNPTEFLVKRVVGVGGDTLACCDSQGRIMVNGIGVLEPFVLSGNAPSSIPFTVTVPPGRLWVMGDHRANSEDSRFHRDLASGTISVRNVAGKVVAIGFPLRHAHWVRGAA